MKGKIIFGIVTILLICAVILGALAAFTDIFKKDKTPTLEYKSMANGDEVNKLYFNTSKSEFSFNDVFVILNYGDYLQDTNGSYSVLCTAKYDGGTICIGLYQSDLYGVVQLYAVNVNGDWTGNGGTSETFGRKLLYSSVLDEENGVKKIGWQVDTFDFSDFTDKKAVVSMSESELALQDFYGSFISSNGVFLEA